MDNLRELIIEAQYGSLTAFDEIVGRFYNMAFRYAHAILGDRDLAEDAVQESFIQAYLSLPSLREPLAFPVWLRTIISRCSGRLLHPASNVPLDELAGIASDALAPSEIAEQKEMAGWIREAIYRLPAPERDVTRLYYLDEHSQREIAEFLKLPITTVNNRLHSSRRKLKQQAMQWADRTSAPYQKTGRRPHPVSIPTKEATMPLTYQPTTRPLLKGDVKVSIRRMTRQDIPAMRRLDEEITAGMEVANAQRPPGGESCPGGPWSDDQWLLEHFEAYDSCGNITLLAADEKGKLIGFADLWATREPEPFGASLDIECIDFLWEYYHLGLETVLLQEAEKVAREAGLPALDIGTNTSSGDYPTLRRFGMKVFYEYDRAWCRPLNPQKPLSHRILPPAGFDRSGLIRISHWCPTDFDFAHEPDRPGVHEFTAADRRVVADFWRLYEPGQKAPIDCELYAPAESLTSPPLMNTILSAAASLAAGEGAEWIPLPCPCEIAIDTSQLSVMKREFAFAWMRKSL